MKLLVDPPELVPELVCALNETDCLAAQTGVSTVEVLAPWLLDGGDRDARGDRAALLRPRLGVGSPAVPGDAARRPLASLQQRVAFRRYGR